MLTKRLIKPPAESTYVGLSVFKLYSETDDIIQGENNEKRTRGLEKSKKGWRKAKLTILQGRGALKMISQKHKEIQIMLSWNSREKIV